MGELRDLPVDVPPAKRALVAEMRHGYRTANLSFKKLAGPTHSSTTTVHRWINGQGALPPLAAVQAWAGACGTSEERMTELWHAASTESLLPQPARRRRLMPLIALSAVAVVALVGMVIRVSTPEPPPPPPPASQCEPYPARVFAPPTANQTFDIAMDVHCPPRSGRAFWLFIRGDNIGDHGSTNYYPNFRLRPAKGRQVTQNFVKPSDADGERFYLVVSVTEKVSATLNDKREFVNHLPPSGEIASPSVRTVISHR